MLLLHDLESMHIFQPMFGWQFFRGSRFTCMTYLNHHLKPNNLPVCLYWDETVPCTDSNQGLGCRFLLFPGCAALNEPYAAVAFITSHVVLPHRGIHSLPPAHPTGVDGMALLGCKWLLFCLEREEAMKYFLNCFPRHQLACWATCTAPAVRSEWEDDDGCSVALDQGIGIPVRAAVGRCYRHRRQHRRGSRDVEDDE